MTSFQVSIDEVVAAVWRAVLVSAEERQRQMHTLLAQIEAEDAVWAEPSSLEPALIELENLDGKESPS